MKILGEIFLNRENKKLKWKLIIQSFFPLSLLVIIKNLTPEILQNLINFFRKLFRGKISVLLDLYDNPHTWIFLVILIFLLVAISGYIAIWQFKEVQFSGFTDAGEKVKIEEEITDSGITFFMTYVLSFMNNDIGSYNGFIVYIGIISLVIIFMAKTNLYYKNPILSLLGYKLYKIKFINPSLNECIDKQFIAVCRNGLDEDKIVKWKYISDNICIMYNKH